MNYLRLFNNRLTLQYNTRSFVKLFLIATVWVLIFAISLTSGSFESSVDEIWQTLRGRSTSTEYAIIVFEFRLPRSLVAAFAGALFALSGASLQSLTRNPLADPSLIGISQGAALAVVALTIWLPEQTWLSREWAAFVGGLIIALLIRISAGKGHSLKFILIGIGLSFFMAALTQTLLTYGATENAISALSWLAGSVNQATWLDSKILGFVLFFILTIQLAQARLFKPTALGYETSIGLGVSMPLFGASQMSIAVIAASIATAVVGPMGFVGLLAPHIARRLVASSAFVFILLTATIGATLVLLADLIGRTWFGSTAIAAGLITSLVGAPTFIFLVLKQKQN